MRGALALCFVAVAACWTGNGSSTMEKSPMPHSSDAHAALVPAAQLIAWLDAQQDAGKPRRLRLPMVLKPSITGYSNSDARVGAAADALVVNLDDSSLGMSLSDRAKRVCPAGAPTCAIWVDGFWKGKTDDGYVFKVMKAGEGIRPDELAAATAGLAI
jgi:hypothetical protein